MGVVVIAQQVEIMETNRKLFSFGMAADIQYGNKSDDHEKKKYYKQGNRIIVGRNQLKSQN